jgi:hypothetical protein
MIEFPVRGRAVLGLCDQSGPIMVASLLRKNFDFEIDRR